LIKIIESAEAQPNPNTDTIDSTPGQNIKRRRTPSKNENALLSFETKGFTGETLELGAVLGLFSEKLDKGVSFDKFTDLIKNYTLKTIRTLKI